MDGEYLPMFLFLSVGAIALFSFLSVASWADARRREREAYYKSEALKKISEGPSGTGSSALDYLREEEKIAMRRRREGQKLGGLITTSVGFSTMLFLVSIGGHKHNLVSIGAIPLLIGIALLVYAYRLAPKE